jgi:protein involved in polysaccharide export with SLBB domain
MKSHWIIASLIGVFLAGCATKGPSFDPRAHTSAAFAPAGLTNHLDPAWLRPKTDPYRLGPGDVIEVELLGEATSQHTSVTVGPDGKIYYSLLPGVSVWGLTLAETRDLLKSEFSKYNKATPDPLVTLRAVGSKRIWMLGAGTASGVYTLASPTTLLEAISSSGGIPAAGADTAYDLSRSFVMRGGKRLPVNFERLFKQGDMSQNIYLEPDDFIFVRPADTANIYVMGAVR